MSAIDRAEPTDPIKLNHCYQLMISLNSEGKYEEAIKVGKEAFDSAISQLDSLSDEHYKAAIPLMQIIRDEIVILNDKIKFK
jgi:hypothetical protein